MMASGKHHVQGLNSRWKPYAVVRQDIVDGPRPGARPRGRSLRRTRDYHMTYTTVSRHWTFKAAQREQRRLDRAGGFSV